MAEDSKPILSIITVVLNSGNALEKTIRSIEEQNFRDFEYIIMDGGSKDNTLDVIKNHSAYVNRWVSEPDKGLYDAMNKGLDIATGKYVWFINAGDQIYNRFTLENLFKDKDSSIADIYYGEAVIIDEDGNEIGMRRQKVPDHLTWKSLKMGMVVSHQAFIAKRSIVSYYNLNYKYSADIDWVIRSLKVSKNIVNTKQVLSRFLEGGRSKQTIIPSLRERFIIMTEFYGLIPTILYHFPIAAKFFVFLSRNRRF